MTLDELKEQMQELGYKWQEYKDSFKAGLFFKRIETKRPCVSNSKDQLTVEVYDTGAAGKDRFSLTVDLTGEFLLVEEPQWAKLQVYGLSPEQFVRQHKSIEAALIRAWEALV